MKKLVKAGIYTMAAMMILSGCSKQDKGTATPSDAQSAGVETEAYVEKGSIKLGEYKGIPVSVTKAEVSEEEVDAQIEQALNSNPEFTEVDREAKEGDTVNIDYVGLLDGTEFDGGTAQGFDLELGSHRFIDGFEDGLVGLKKGDKKDLNLTFPDPYQNEEMAGKAVVFQVTVNSVKEKKIPELTDEFVIKISPDAKNVDEYKQKIRENILQQKQYGIDSQRNMDIMEALLSNSEIVCATDDVDKEFETQLQMYTNQAAMYGMDLAAMASIYGMEEDMFKAEIRRMAEDVTKQKMLFNEIAEKENISVTDEDRLALAKENDHEDVASLIETYGEEQVEEAALSQKIMNFLVDNAKVTTVESTSASTEGTKESAAE